MRFFFSYFKAYALLMVKESSTSIASLHVGKRSKYTDFSFSLTRRNFVYLEQRGWGIKGRMQLPLVDVHAETVSLSWPLLLEAVRDADFIALDLVNSQ